MERRTFVRALVGVGFGVPAVVEGATLVGMVDGAFGRDESSPGTTPPENDGRGVDVGDDLFPGEDPTARVREAVVLERRSAWRFRLGVAVHNGGSSPVDLRLPAVETTDGERVTDGDGSGRLAPGDRTTVTATWSLPPGARPAALTTVVVTYGDGGTATGTERRRVPLAPVPVRGSSGR